MREVTFGFVKPGAYYSRKKILREFILPSGLRAVAERDPYLFTEEVARQHYEALSDQSFFGNLILFTAYGLRGVRTLDRRQVKTALYILEGENAVRVLDEITGPTNPGIARGVAKETKQETIRSQYGIGMPDNAFHRADSHASARREIMLHFRRNELPDYIWEMLDREPYV